MTKVKVNASSCQHDMTALQDLRRPLSSLHAGRADSTDLRSAETVPSAAAERRLLCMSAQLLFLERSPQTSMLIRKLTPQLMCPVLCPVSCRVLSCLVSCVLCPVVSCVLCPVSCVLCPVSCVMCPVSCVLCPVSCPVLCHVTCVMCCDVR